MITKATTPFFVFFFISIAFELSNGDEIRHLLSFKSSIKDPSQFLSNWFTSTPLCNWYGITCSPSKTHVLKLNLSSINISGELSPFIFHLPFIQSIDLSGNNLHGQIPETLFSCISLHYLNLSNNMISGFIPVSMGFLSNLRYLDLGGNALMGKIPSSVSNMTKLEFLTMASNQISGEIPAELGELKNLKWVYLGYNNLSGKIPNEMGLLSSLNHLDLVYNHFSGSIPSSFGNLTNLEYLFLYQNKLSGEIPPSIFSLENLVSLDLSDNFLSGEIPEEITHLKKLQILHLFSNNLTGKIPSSISLLPHLQVLQLWSNNLHGQIPQDLGKNNNLTILDLSTNFLSGKIPNPLCKSGKLSKLILFSNSLQGEIPSSLSSCHSLKRIRVQKNSLSGGLPEGFTKLENVYFLDISSNNLSGNIVDNQWEMPRLQMLNLAKNRFVGFLPDFSGSVKIENLDLSENYFSGIIPPSYGKLSELRILNLARNEIRGPIPEELALCKKLVTLDLSHNGLTGPILRGLGQMPVLGKLDLSENEFSGEVPGNLGAIDSLVEVNISYNHLHGMLPSTGAFLAISFSAVVGNDNLCGGVHPTNGLPPCRGVKGPTAVVWWGLVTFLGVVIMVVVSPILCVLVFIRRRRQRWMKVQTVENEDGIWKVHFFDPKASKFLSVQDIFTMKNPNNINNMDFFVEELRFDNYYSISSNYDVWEEISRLGKIRHPNVVKLVGACKCKKGGFLIYENVMEGKSLSEIVHELSWVRRRRIALGIARALKFLHDYCLPGVLVGEMSPGRVIIDGENGEARLRLDIGGLFYLKPKSFLSSPYMAPETKESKAITDKNDIYGFGLLLIELLTGRGPMDSEVGAHGSIIDWAQYCYSDCHLDTWIDPVIRDQRFEYHSEIVEIMSLAIKCTAIDPTTRPRSSDAVKTLESILKPRSCVLGFEISK